MPNTAQAAASPKVLDGAIPLVVETLVRVDWDCGHQRDRNIYVDPAAVDRFSEIPLDAQIQL